MEHDSEETMDPWLVMMLAGLGSMKFTDLIKEIVPWPLQPWTRSMLCLVTALALCALLSNGKILILLAFGSAGLSSVFHEIAGVLAMKSDDLKQTIMVRAATSRRRSI